MRYQQPPPLPIEFALVVECCRQAFAGGNRADAPRLVEQADWEQVLAITRRHRVQGLVWHGATALGLAMPDGVRAALSSEARGIAEHGLRAAAESSALREAFGRAGIPLLFVKGLTIGKLAYNDPFLKMAWDVDLLVPPEQVAEAGQLLQGLGYSSVTPSPDFAPESLRRWHKTSKESEWRKPNGLVVELHTRLADNQRLIPGIDVHSPTQHVAVAPGITLPTLADDELFAYLCAHGASSSWFRLKWITDLAGFLHRRSSGDVVRLHRRSKQLGAGRAGGQALLLAHWLYGIPIELGLGRAENWLARAALDELTNPREPTERPLGTRMIHLTQFFLLPGPAFKLSELKRQAQMAVLRG